MSRLVRVALALLWAMAGSITYASTTSVTATLTDPDGQVWGNCVWSAIVVSDYPPTIGGVPVPESQLRTNGSCNASGLLTATMLNTSSVQQNNVTWTFTIQPNASVPPSVVPGVAVTGGSINLSAVLSAGIKAPRFGAGPNSYGYADVEVNSSSIGNTYFNTGSVCGGPSLRQLSNAGWQCGGSGGGGGALFPDTPGLVYSTSDTTSTTATPTQVNTALGLSNGVQVIGDSIACSTGATSWATAFANLLRVPIGGWWSDACRPGDQAADGNIKTVFRATYAQGGGLDPVYVHELGTNDAINYLGNTNKQAIFRRIVQGSLSWDAIPVANRKFAQTCTLAGGFAADAAAPGGLSSNPYLGLQIVGTTTGATATCITNNPAANGELFLWYKIADGTTGTFAVTVDGNPLTDPITGGTTWIASGDGGATIATGNAVTTAVAGTAPLGSYAAGNHTIVVTITSSGQNVWFDAVGFTPAASSTNNPWVLAVSPNQQNVSSAGSPFVAAYRAILSDTVNALSGPSVGLNVLYVDTAAALLNDPSCGGGNQATMFANCYSDSVHPNNTGHAVMANTIVAATPAFKRTGINSITGNSLGYYNPTGAPIGPMGFLNVNPFNIGVNGPYIPGLLLFSGQGQMEYIAHTGTGAGLVTSTPTGVPMSWCHSGAGGYSSPTAPTDANCGLKYQGNGAWEWSGGSGVAAGLTIQGGLLATGTSFNMNLAGPVNVTNANSGPLSTVTATASVNSNSPCWYWKAGTWNAILGVPGFGGPCLRAEPISPTPGGSAGQVLLTLRGDAAASQQFGFNISNATLPNLLGLSQMNAGSTIGGLPISATTTPNNVTIASASTIAPTGRMVVVSGTATIDNITPPSDFSSTQGACIDILATGAWTTSTAGNIASVVSASAGVPYRACYFNDSGTPKFYIK